MELFESGFVSYVCKYWLSTLLLYMTLFLVYSEGEGVFTLKWKSLSYLCSPLYFCIQVKRVSSWVSCHLLIFKCLTNNYSLPTYLYMYMHIKLNKLLIIQICQLSLKLNIDFSGWADSVIWVDLFKFKF